MAFPARHHRMLTLLALLLLVPVLAAFGRSAGTLAQDKFKISYWMDPTFGMAPVQCAIDNVVTPFNEQSETIEVEVTLQPNAWQATQTSVAGGGGPDVVGTPGPTYALEMSRAGQILPLDDYAAEYGWAETFVPWALDLGRVDGKLYSVPNELETLVLYYNKTLFDEHGWQPPTTMDELMTLAATINEAGVIPFAHANAEWRPANEWFVGEFFNHVAGPQKVYDALTGTAKWTDPEFVQSVDLLTQMQQEGWFMGGLDRYYTATTDERYTAFGDGEAAMNIEGTWFLSQIDDYFGEAAGNESEWGWVPVPSTTGEAIFNLGIGSTYSINANAENPEAVAEFLSYFFSPEVRARALNTCGTAPAPVSLEGQSMPDLDPRKVEIFNALNTSAAANNYGYLTWAFWPQKTNTYLIEEVEKVWAGDITSQEYLEGMQEVFDEEFAAGALPPIPTR